MKTIEHWSLTAHPVNFTPLSPEDAETTPMYVLGVAEDHGKMKDIRTSPIVARVDGEAQVVTRSGSVYGLGEPDADYERIYNNARERLLESLPIHRPAAPAPSQPDEHAPGL